MESRPQYVPADWLSRIVSVISLAVAIGAVIYLRMNHNQLVKLPETLRSDFQGRLTEETAKYEQAYQQKQAGLESRVEQVLESHDKWLTQQWNAQIGDALDTFKQDADQLLQEIETNATAAHEARQLAFRQQLLSFNSTAEDTSPTAETSEGQSPSPAPDDSLAALHTVQRPTNDTQALIRIENSGSEEAVITRVRFAPQTDFRVAAGEQNVSILNGAEDIVTLAYGSSDNTSSKSGMHGLYDRTMTEPIRVPAGGALTFRVLIEDPSHVGWGFAGKLVLDYNGQEPLVVDSARVFFQTVASAKST